VVVLSHTRHGSDHARSRARHVSCNRGHTRGQLDGRGRGRAWVVGFTGRRPWPCYVSVGRGHCCGRSQWSEAGSGCVELVVVRCQEAINGGVRNSLQDRHYSVAEHTDQTCLPGT
jgi:hypothetical protein